jgi:hypothetical protein
MESLPRFQGIPAAVIGNAKPDGGYQEIRRKTMSMEISQTRYSKFRIVYSAALQYQGRPALAVNVVLQC